ncbi:MAG: hypothetical protein EOP83_14830 [Verrucomicrobiaceae bacterium]|nr:MAG: hypothetical protein EOP83_14830 [Verrucomicrobiaceae bacterium]
MADALDMTTAILDIHFTNLWQYGWTPNGSEPFIQTEVEKWWRDNLGKDCVRKIVREVRILDRDGGLRNSYRVFLLFADEPSMVHFRLRWGGQPVAEMPVNRSTIIE